MCFPSYHLKINGCMHSYYVPASENTMGVCIGALQKSRSCLPARLPLLNQNIYVHRRLLILDKFRSLK